MEDILKEHGLLYIEEDYVNNTQKKFIKGTIEEVLAAFNEIMAKGLLFPHHQ